MKHHLRLLAVVVVPLASFAQEFRGTISGTVAAPTGPAIAGAKITVIETHTGVTTSVVSGSTGQYTALFLLSGDYEIAARMPGFKDAVRKGVHIGAGDHPIIDIRLVVADAAQSRES